MKYIKMLGLAAVAAMALMAFAGSASATTLTGGATGSEKAMAAGEEIHATLIGSAELKSGSTVLDTCTESTIKGTIGNAGGPAATVSGKVSKTNLTWGNCTWHTTTIADGELEIHHIAGTSNGTVTAKNFQVTINGIFGTSCVYGAGEGIHLGELKGGHPATIEIDTTVPEITSLFSCPDTATWKAKYTVTSPTVLKVDA